MKTFHLQILTLAAIIFVSNVVSAQINIPDSSGLAGYAIILPGYVNARTSQFSEGAPATGELSNKQVNSIYQSPGATSTGMLALGGEINYTWSKSRTQVFLGNRLEDLLRMDVVFGLGVRQELKDSSILAFSILYTPLELLLWEDPYIENEDRQATALNFPGARLRWGRMFGTELELTATARIYRFEDEKSGQWLLGQNRLAAEELGDLDRNGTVYRIQALYIIGKGKHKFLPAFRYRLDNHDGTAISNQGYLAKFTYLYFTKRLVLDVNAGYGQVWAEGENPIYGQTMETNRYIGGFSAIVPFKLFKKRSSNLLRKP